jgi:hypothetical protein
MMMLEGMCQRNISVASAARSTGLSPNAIKPEHAIATKRELAKIPIVRTLWEDLLKRVRQTDANLFMFDQESPGHHAKSDALSA